MTATQSDPDAEIIRAMRFEDYVLIDALNASTLKKFAISGLAGAWYLTEGQAETAAMNRGTAFHKVCEDGDFNNIVRHTATKSVTTKAFQEERDALEPGKILLVAEEWDRLLRMYESFSAHPLCKKVLTDASFAEHTIIWHEPLLGGVKCKARIDRLWEGIGAVDIKTTATLTIADVERSIWKYGYHIQAAWYMRAMQVAYGIHDPAWLFAWQETSPPYDSALSGIPVEDIQQGWAEIEIAASRYRAYRDRSEANGIAHNNRLTLGLPRWSQDKLLRPVNSPYGGSA